MNSLVKVIPTSSTDIWQGRWDACTEFRGDRPLVQEASDAIRTAARRAGADERVVYHVERGFDWQEMPGSRMRCRFASRKLLELRLASAKPGDKG